MKHAIDTTPPPEIKRDYIMRKLFSVIMSVENKEQIYAAKTYVYLAEKRIIELGFPVNDSFKIALGFLDNMLVCFKARIKTGGKDK